MAEKNTIAVICDCDGTLCSDTTDQLVSRIGADPGESWGVMNELVQDGWDPPIAYLTRLLELGQSGQVEAITIDVLREVGESISFYPGVLDFMRRLQQGLNRNLPNIFT